MSEKLHIVNIAATDINYSLALTLGQINALIENCQAVKAQAEAEKPQAWDFGIGCTGNLCVRGYREDDDRTEWGGGMEGKNPWSSCYGKAADTTVHIYGNLKKIIEEEGPIVVGTKPEYVPGEAVRLRQGGYGTMADNLEAALARYERNKP